MLDLIEILFQREAIRYLRYDGKMTTQAREAALGTFKRAGGPRVILIRFGDPCYVSMNSLLY